MTESDTSTAVHYQALTGNGFVAGIDLGGTKILVAIVGPDGSILTRAKKKSGRGSGDAGVVIDRIADCVREATKAAEITLGQIKAIGIGAPGPIVLETGVVSVAVNLGWHDVPLKAELERRLDVPVAVDNDVRVAVLAEYLAGAGRGSRNMIGIWPGTGIGGGVVLNGEIFVGSTNSAGEVGHMTIKAGGALCACGGKGHLESLASRTAIVRDITERVQAGEKSALTSIVGPDVSLATSGDLAAALNQGDKLVIRVLDRAAKYLSIGIASLANLLNPEVVVLGGGLVQALGDPFVRLIAQKVEGRPMLAATKPLKIVQSVLGDDAGIIGSAIVARRLANRLEVTSV
ncbi:MAG TPA: ROK family protein, partial [Chloroflexota bacterium]|nr:ROK family protein [Chloroflexota bacterium]